MCVSTWGAWYPLTDEVLEWDCSITNLHVTLGSVSRNSLEVTDIFIPKTQVEMGCEAQPCEAFFQQSRHTAVSQV